MSFIQTYRRDIDDLVRFAGADNEGSISQAFAGLLKSCGEESNLILCQQYRFKSVNSNTTLVADGVLLDRIRIVHGYWEAKDTKDNLDQEIKSKIALGYPTENIIFEDTVTAVLYQNDIEVLRISLSDDKQLQKLLDLFFGYVSREVGNFKDANIKFLKELPIVASALTNMIVNAYNNNTEFNIKSKKFLNLCKRAIGTRVTARHVEEMLIQHILTEEIFSAIFPTSIFHKENHLARAVTELESTLLEGNTKRRLLSKLEPYFATIRRTALNATTSIDKQSFLKKVYEDFYSAYNPKDADKLGVIYTPNEVVRFIIDGCDYLTQKHFNFQLSDQNIDILDPCTGTGTFIVDLIDYLRCDRTALIRKFQSEIHFNEISILPYYIACLNIEQTFYDVTGKWLDFKGACFVNTLDNWGFDEQYKDAQGNLLSSITDENQERILAQNKRRIPVIIGNPPYNANQKSENDDNKNDEAFVADKRIKETYVAASTAQKTKQYDMYIRFVRWSSDRIGEQGIIGFITNRSYLDSRQADGFRKVVAKEFQQILIIDLLGNARQMDGKEEQGGNIFGIMTGTAIVFLVKNPKLQGCDIRYIVTKPEFTGKEKLCWLASTSLHNIVTSDIFEQIYPNNNGDWIKKAKFDWSEYINIASKEAKIGKSDNVIFRMHSLGISTNRDEWVYGFTKLEVSRKVKFFISVLNNTIQKWKKVIVADSNQNFSIVVNRQIKWTPELEALAKKGFEIEYKDDCIINCMYRPFVIKNIYWSKHLINRRCVQPKIFGVNGTNENIVIWFTNPGSQKPFMAFATAIVGDLHLVGASCGSESLPLYVYDDDGKRHDNITDWSLRQFRLHFNEQSISKLDIFHYVYAVLHSQGYRKDFARNLNSELPRIPFFAEFSKLASMGKSLVKLHVDFQNIESYPLARSNAYKLSQVSLPNIGVTGEQLDFNLINSVPKCKLKANITKGIIEIDDVTKLSGIPDEAWQFQLGSKSALELILDQYRDSLPKDATVRENFSEYRFSDHKENLIELLKKVCTVSVESVAIQKSIQNIMDSSNVEMHKHLFTAN